jgi:hypothetical protein
MRKDTRRELVAAGWRVGDAAEFLVLSEVEAEVAEIKLALADLLWFSGAGSCTRGY